MTKQADKHIDDSSTRRSCAGADAKKISVPHKLVLVSENSGSEKPEQKNNEVENPEPDNQKQKIPNWKPSRRDGKRQVSGTLLSSGK